MQLTLVSHYGTKPCAFDEWITRLQQRLASCLGDAFSPYAVAQVHGTIVGLEGVRCDSGVRNENFLRYRNTGRLMDFQGLLEWLRSPAFPRLAIRLGGFHPKADYGFLSQGRHPFDRSFAIQGEVAVAMGWPFDATSGRWSDALDELRRGFQQFGVLHKWHRHPADVDNDFFFVLGRISTGCDGGNCDTAAAEIGNVLAHSPPLDLEITRATLAFVAYEDARLPWNDSRAFTLFDARISGAFLESLF